MDRTQFPVYEQLGMASPHYLFLQGDVKSLKQFSVIEEDISADNPEFNQSQSAIIILDVFSQICKLYYNQLVSVKGLIISTDIL